MFFSHTGIIRYDELWLPTAKSATVRDLFIDWARCGRSLTINGQSLQRLHEEAGIIYHDGQPTETPEGYVRKIIFPYILSKLPKEDSLSAEVTSYQKLIKKYRLETLYKLNYPDFQSAILLRSDLNVEEKIAILELEDSRQLTLLDEQFPDTEENVGIRQHLRALNQMKNHFYQAAAFDQPGLLLSARAEALGFVQNISGFSYTVTTTEGTVNLTTEAKIEKLVPRASDPESGGAVTPTDKDGRRLPFVQLKSHYQLKVTRHKATFHSKRHTLNINSKEAKGFKQKDPVEKANHDIQRYLRGLVEQVAQSERALELHLDPLMPIIMPSMSETEKLLKQKKIAVLSATCEFLSKGITLKTLCQVLILYPGWHQGHPSKSFSLVKSALHAFDTSEALFAHTMMEVKLEDTISNLENELSQTPPLPEEKMIQKTQLLTVLRATLSYHKGERGAELLQDAISKQEQWSSDSKAPGYQLIQQVLEDKPLNPTSPTSP